MRKTLSVCIIVKNESHQIASLLNTLLILADEIVIVDTGSNDNTIEIINQWTKEHNASRGVKVLPVGNKFHDSDGDFDFGAAKTFAFENATKDYVMWLDASDRVSEPILCKQKFIELTTENNVIITLPTRTKSRHTFNRLRIGPRLLSTMVGRIHEYMWISDVTGLKRFHINIPIDNFKESRDLSRNIRILKKEYAREPSARNAFYIGNSYHGMKQYSESIEWFRKRVYSYEWADEYAEEFYKSLECIAESIVKLNNAFKLPNHLSLADLMDIANNMITREPKRVEGYYYLGMYNYILKKYSEAIDIFAKYKDCVLPTDVKLWLDPEIYNGGMVKMIEKCRMAIKLSTPLMPEEILDLPGHGENDRTYSIGDNQYGSQTVF